MTSRVQVTGVCYQRSFITCCSLSASRPTSAPLICVGRLTRRSVLCRYFILHICLWLASNSGFLCVFLAVDIVIDLTMLCNMVPVEIIFARIFLCRPPQHGRYCSESCPSSCPSVATLACPVRAPGYNAPLIRFLISALYICLLVYIVCFLTCGFSSLFLTYLLYLFL